MLIVCGLVACIRRGGVVTFFDGGAHASVAQGSSDRELESRNAWYDNATHLIGEEQSKDRRTCNDLITIYKREVVSFCTRAKSNPYDKKKTRI
jgi:hypothetical protein